MWHFKNKDFEVHGTRQELKEKLNIFMVGFGEGDDYHEELADIYNERHWKQICKEYGIWGNDVL